MPMPAPVDRFELKSIVEPAASESEAPPAAAAMPRHAAGSRPMRAAKSAADSPASASALLSGVGAAVLPGPVPDTPGAVAVLAVFAPSLDLASSYLASCS